MLGNLVLAAGFGMMGLMGNPPRRRRKHARRRNPSDGAHELALYIVNDGDLYRQNIKYVIANLAKKIKKGTYDAKLALKLWKHSADWGAKKYTKEHGGSGNGSYGAFNATDRRDAAAELQDYYQEELNDAAGIKANPRGGRDLTTEVFHIGQNTVVTTQWRNSNGTAFISVQTGGPIGVKVWEAKSQGPSAGGYHKPTQAAERVYHKIMGEYPHNFGGAGRKELEEIAKAAVKARQNPRRRKSRR